MEPAFFERPEVAPIKLGIHPRLASWNAAGDPDQVRLGAALADAETVIAPVIAKANRALALRLDVGLPPSVRLLGEHDLDNYLYPLAAHLMKSTGRSFVSVWGTKQQAEDSSVRVEIARPTARPADADYSCLLRTTASGSSTMYKQQIREQLLGARELADGPVALQIGFVVGPRRNWLNLWKPTIDALDLLLGRTRPDRDWHPRDGRITDLGLHGTVDTILGNDVVIAVAARSLEEDVPTHRTRA